MPRREQSVQQLPGAGAGRQPRDQDGMARAVRQPVVLMKWYRVVSWMLDRVDHFPKNQRFVFGQRLAERSIHVLELLVEAAW